jgi:hypothetical protein
LQLCCRINKEPSLRDKYWPLEFNSSPGGIRCLLDQSRLFSATFSVGCWVTLASPGYNCQMQHVASCLWLTKTETAKGEKMSSRGRRRWVTWYEMMDVIEPSRCTVCLDTDASKLSAGLFIWGAFDERKSRLDCCKKEKPNVPARRQSEAKKGKSS